MIYFMFSYYSTNVEFCGFVLRTFDRSYTNCLMHGRLNDHCMISQYIFIPFALRLPCGNIVSTTRRTIFQRMPTNRERQRGREKFGVSVVTPCIDSALSRCSFRNISSTPENLLPRRLYRFTSKIYHFP